MFVRAKQADLSINPAKRLESLEDRLRVEKDCCGRIDCEGSVWLNARTVPALLLIEIAAKPVICEELTETERALGRFVLRCGCARDLNRLMHGYRITDVSWRTRSQE